MKPLTIEELKALEIGDWVWVINLVDRTGLYKQISDICEKEAWLWLVGNCYASHFSDYGTNWIAYKNKEQVENAGYRNVDKAVKEFAEKVKTLYPLPIRNGKELERFMQYEQTVDNLAQSVIRSNDNV